MAPAVPLMRAAPVRAFVDCLRTWGAPVESLLERASLSPEAVLEGHPEALLPLFGVARFLEIAACSQGVEDLGLQIGSAMGVAHLGVFGSLLLTARTLGDGFARAFRYWSAYDSGARSWIVHRGDRVEVHHRFLHQEAATWHQGTAVTLGLHLQYISGVAGPAWYPTTIDLPVRRFPGVRSHPLLANARLRVGRPTLMVAVPASVFGRALPGGRGVGDAPAVDGWTKGAPARELGRALEQIVTSFLPGGYPDIDRVAAAVGTSTRTLQRRLQIDGESYAGVVGKARYAQACRLLRDPARKIIDVAFDLGYADPAHFTRAFERWTGLPPREFRQRALADPGGS